MKYFLIIPFLLCTLSTSVAQSYRTETVEWLNPKVYKAKSLSFKSDSIEFNAENCKILEFRTISGVTGYYVEGAGNIAVESKKLKEKCTAAMLRFNPAEADSIIKVINLKEIQDDEFVNASLTVLKTTFRHCYHSGMDAIIPNMGAYAVNFFSPRIGEVLVSQDKKEMVYYNFTLRTKL